MTDYKNQKQKGISEMTRKQKITEAITCVLWAVCMCLLGFMATALPIY